MTIGARSTTKKFLAAGGLALGLASLGLVAGPGTAAADGHNILDEDGTWGDPDGAEVREISLAPAVDSYDTSSYPAESSYPAGSGTPQVWPKPLSNMPSASYPGSGWGVADN